MSKFSDSVLYDYLRSHLQFGCIKHVFFNVHVSVVENHHTFEVDISPFHKFCQSDLSFIRCNVLESQDIKDMLNVRLYHLLLKEDNILAVYVIH